MTTTSTAPQDTPPRSTAAGWSPRLWGLLFVLSGNMLLDALEVSVVIVALPSIGRDLHLSSSGAQWMMSGFALGFGGLLLFGGRVVTLLGRRRVYIAALAVFAVASLVAGLVSVTPILIATRFVKGFCAALTQPTGLAIIGSTFREGADRNRAVSVYSLFGAAGFSVGLVLSGLFTQLDWRWVFLFPAPIALALFVFGSRLIPRDAGDEHTGRRYDGLGAVCFAAAAVLVVYTIVTGPAVGWRDPRVIGGFVLAAALLAAAIHIERRSVAPLIRFALLARGKLIRSSLGAAALNGSFWGFLFIATFQLQSVLGWTPWQTALAFLPATIVLALSAPFAGRMVGRFGAPWLITLGALTPPIGYILYLVVGPSPTYVTAILPTMLLVGLGFVLAFAALHIQATVGVPGPDLAMTTGAYQSSVQIGGAVMLAAVAALLNADQAPAGASVNAALSGYRPALLLVTVVGVVGFLVALTGVSRTGCGTGRVGYPFGYRRLSAPSSRTVARRHFPGQRRCTAHTTSQGAPGMTRIGIIIGSTRPGRKAEAVAKWVHDLAGKRDDATYELVDLADYDLPHLDEPTPAAKSQNYTQDHTRAWATAIASYDGYVFVTPEYNHSTSGVLKNAIDFLFVEWQNKSAGFVSYGLAGGTRAVEHLRLVMAELQVADVRAQVALSLFADFDDGSDLNPGPHQEETLTRLLDQVVAWAEALAPLHAAIG